MAAARLEGAALARGSRAMATNASGSATMKPCVSGCNASEGLFIAAATVQRNDDGRWGGEPRGDVEGKHDGTVVHVSEVVFSVGK